MPKTLIASPDADCNVKLVFSSLGFGLIESKMRLCKSVFEAPVSIKALTCLFSILIKHEFGTSLLVISGIFDLSLLFPVVDLSRQEEASFPTA